MAKLTINRGSQQMTERVIISVTVNKVNLNFDEIYTAIGDGTTVDGTIKVMTIVYCSNFFSKR